MRVRLVGKEAIGPYAKVSKPSNRQATFTNYPSV
jgi:hypothetical protein